MMQITQGFNLLSQALLLLSTVLWLTLDPDAIGPAGIYLKGSMLFIQNFSVTVATLLGLLLTLEFVQLFNFEGSVQLPITLQRIRYFFFILFVIGPCSSMILTLYLLITPSNNSPLWAIPVYLSAPFVGLAIITVSIAFPIIVLGIYKESQRKTNSTQRNTLERTAATLFFTIGLLTLLDYACVYIALFLHEANFWANNLYVSLVHINCSSLVFIYFKIVNLLMGLNIIKSRRRKSINNPVAQDK